jgi:hypothetical protein
MLSAQEIDFVEELYVSNQGKIEEISESTDNEIEFYKKLDNSLLLIDYIDIYFYKSFKVLGCADFANILVIKTFYKIRSGKYNIGDYELQLIGMKSLNKNFGNILLRPETLADKIVELFSRTEIDFNDYPLFSTKYYLLADNESLCKSFATNQRINLIEDQNEILIQVMDNLLIAKYCRLLNHSDFVNLVDFIKRI